MPRRARNSVPTAWSASASRWSSGAPRPTNWSTTSASWPPSTRNRKAPASGCRRPKRRVERRMVPVSLFIWIVLEVTVYLAIGRHFLHLDWPLAMVGAFNCVLGLRFWLNAVTWYYGMTYASPAPPLGFARRLAIMAGEYFAFLLTFLLVIPFERLWMPADRLPSGRRPLLQE